MPYEWESCVGVLEGLKLTREGWAEQLNPHGHGFIVQGGNVFQCVGVNPGSKLWFFVVDMDVGGNGHAYQSSTSGPSDVCLFFSKESSQVVMCC